MLTLTGTRKAAALAILIALGTASAADCFAQSRKPTPFITGKWDLDEWDSYVAGKAQRKAWIEFTPDGVMVIDDGCSRFTTRYRQDAGMLTIEGAGDGLTTCSTGQYPADLLNLFVRAVTRNGMIGPSGRWMRFMTRDGDIFLLTPRPH